MRIRDRFDSNESYACCLGDDFGGLMRPRSRSLTFVYSQIFKKFSKNIFLEVQSLIYLNAWELILQ